MKHGSDRKSFSSKDFGATRPAIVSDVPDRLIHRGVDRANADCEFSGTREHPVWIVDVPSRAISMTLGGLEPGQRTRRHRHSYETILYVIEGEGVTIIESTAVEWSAGDAVYVPVWAWHHHMNRSVSNRCRYVACENAPMLQNLGVALREEAGAATATHDR
jgi:quercetin dioxygenase-like cupin family protein